MSRYIYNFDIVGNLGITNGVATGFSSTVYGILPQASAGLNSANWEFGTCITTGSNVATDQQIFAPFSDQRGTRIEITSDSKFGFLNGYNGSWVNTSNYKSSYTVLPNTTYYLKASYSSNTYTLSYSLDDDTYTTIVSYTSTTIISPNQYYIGNIDSLDQPFLGSIDLTKTYIKLWGVTSWEAVNVLPDYNGTHIQLRHDTASNWSSVNPVLLDGEVALASEQQASNIPTTAFTSASTGGWVATCNNYSQQWSSEWYKVFDSTVSSGWYEGNSFGNPAWIQLMFPEELTLTKITLEQNGVSNCLSGNGYVSVVYSNNTMEQVGTFSMDTTVSKEYTVEFSEAKTCAGIRITITSVLASGNGAGLSTVRLYGNPVNIYKDMRIGNGTTPYNSLPSTISIIDTLKSFAGYTDNGTRALQVIDGVFTWVNI